MEHIGKKVIWSYESRFGLFTTSGRIYVFRTLAKIYDPYWLQNRKEIWCEFSHARKTHIYGYSTGSIIILLGNIKGNVNMKIFSDQMHPICKLCSLMMMLFIKIITPLAPVQIVIIVPANFLNNQYEVSGLSRLPRSLDFNVTEDLWSMLEGIFEYSIHLFYH